MEATSVRGRCGIGKGVLNMFVLILLVVGFAAFVGAIMLLYLAVTGKPPTPRRMVTSLTHHVRRFSQTVRYGKVRATRTEDQPHNRS